MGQGRARADAGDRLTHLRLAYGYEPGTTAVHLDASLRRRLEVTVEGPGHPSHGVDEAAPTQPRPPILWIESGVRWIPPVTSLTPGVSAAWMIDTHRQLRWRATASRAFDVVFVAQRGAVRRFARFGVDATWLPLAAPAGLSADPGPDLAQRRHDVAFAGQVWPGSFRERLLAHLAGVFDVAPVVPRTPEAMMALYRSARVVVNPPLAGDLNMRTFEAAGARALLVTGPADGLDDVLPPGSFEVVPHPSVEAWADAIGSSLRRADLQERADRAHEHVLGHHTYDHRADQVVTAIESATPRRHSLARRRSALASAHAFWGQPVQAARAAPRALAPLAAVSATASTSIRAVRAVLSR